MSENQPMTAAERQRKYRQKNRDDSGGRIDMQVSARTKWDLEDLAERYSVTKKELIERLIREEAIRAGVRFDEEKYQLFIKLDCLANHYRVTRDKVVDSLINEAYEKCNHAFKANS